MGCVVGFVGKAGAGDDAYSFIHSSICWKCLFAFARWRWFDTAFPMHRSIVRIGLWKALLIERALKRKDSADQDRWKTMDGFYGTQEENLFVSGVLFY